MSSKSTISPTMQKAKCFPGHCCEDEYHQDCKANEEYRKIVTKIIHTTAGHFLRGVVRTTILDIQSQDLELLTLVSIVPASMSSPYRFLGSMVPPDWQGNPQHSLSEKCQFSAFEDYGKSQPSRVPHRRLEQTYTNQVGKYADHSYHFPLIRLV